MKLPLYFLKQRQSLPLEAKIISSKSKITQWYNYNQGKVYVSLSGKDSTVLLYLVRSIYPNVPAVSVNTGIEHPENIAFIKNNIENVIWLKPEMSFKDVIESAGYPVVSKMTSRKLHTLQNPSKKNQLSRHLYKTGYTSDGKYSPRSKLPDKWHYLIENEPGIKFSHKCCDIMKIRPIKDFEKQAGLKGYVGTLASESDARRKAYLMTGCNNYNSDGYSKPLSFWLEQDILQYIYEEKIQISEAYGDIVKNENGTFQTKKESRTGCMYCLFGCHLEKEPNRIQRLKVQYPKLYDYCIREQDGLGFGKVMKLLNIPYE